MMSYLDPDLYVTGPKCVGRLDALLGGHLAVGSLVDTHPLTLHVHDGNADESQRRSADVVLTAKHIESIEGEQVTLRVKGAQISLSRYTYGDNRRPAYEATFGQDPISRKACDQFISSMMSVAERRKAVEAV